jgi:hypothetical protein
MSMSIISAYLFHQKLCVVSCLCSFNVRPVCISIHASPFPSLSLHQFFSTLQLWRGANTRSHDHTTEKREPSRCHTWLIGVRPQSRNITTRHNLIIDHVMIIQLIQHCTSLRRSDLPVLHVLKTN